MTQDQNHFSLTFRPYEAPQEQTFRFSFTPDALQSSQIAEELGLSALKKMVFAGAIAPEGRRNWRLTARLGATVEQPCGVTLAPVRTRIDEDITRLYLAKMPEIPEAEEMEIPIDDMIEPLPVAIDIAAVALEALSLAIPAWPRAPGAELGTRQFSAQGVAPMTDDDARPFAKLEEFRKKMSDG